MGWPEEVKKGHERYSNEVKGCNKSSKKKILGEFKAIEDDAMHPCTKV